MMRYVSNVPVMLALGVLAILGVAGKGRADDLTREQALASLRRAVDFFRRQAGVEGGYVFRVSADLEKREGESAVGPTTAWIEPPATPSVGLAYLEAYRLTHVSELLDAARETGRALVRGQLLSGGWDDRIEFAPADRQQFAYRVDTREPQRRRNVTTFDDDKSQSALRFLMELDRELQFQDAAIREAAQFALEAFLQAQYPNGAWPQRYSAFPKADEFPVLRASYPADWPREYPGVKYQAYYTLNDNTLSDLITTMLTAYDIYRDPRFSAAARRGGDFLLLAQMPDPQPGWAQQYDRDMHPAWARKFEPPAITGGESQGVLRTLLDLYRATGDEKYLKPFPRALAYYRSCLRPDGRLARFYELHTNKPLYFTRDYRLAYDDSDVPTHYAFVVSSHLDRLEADYEALQAAHPSAQHSANATASEVHPPPPRRTPKLVARAQGVIEALDDRGAWVEQGRLHDYGDHDTTRQVIQSQTFIKNLQVLAEFIASE